MHICQNNTWLTTEKELARRILDEKSKGKNNIKKEIESNR